MKLLSPLFFIGLFFVFSFNSFAISKIQICRHLNQNSSCIFGAKNHPNFIYLKTGEQINACFLNQKGNKIWNQFTELTAKNYFIISHNSHNSNNSNNSHNSNYTKIRMNDIFQKNCDGFSIQAEDGLISSACLIHRKEFRLFAHIFHELLDFCQG